MPTPRRCGACRIHQHDWGSTTWDPAQFIYGRWVRLYRRTCRCRRCFPACTGHQAMVEPNARPHIARDFSVPEDRWPTDFLEPVSDKEPPVPDTLEKRTASPDRGRQPVDATERPLTAEQKHYQAALDATQKELGIDREVAGKERGEFLGRVLRALEKWDPPQREE